MQIKFIHNNSEKILKNSKKLYEKVTIYKSGFFVDKCAKFKELEDICLEYPKKMIQKLE